MTLSDGSVGRLLNLSFNSGKSFEMEFEGGYEAGDQDGDMLDFGEDTPRHDEENSENGSGNTQSGAAAGGEGNQNPPPDYQAEPPEHGGNGHNMSASADFSLTQTISEDTGLNIGALLTLDGNVDDVPDEELFGHMNFGHDESGNASVGQSFDLGIQVSSGDQDEGTDEHAYLRLGFGGNAGGGGNLNFNLDVPFGETPDVAMPTAFSGDTGIPSAPIGPQTEGIDLGFGVGLEDFGNGNANVAYSERTLLELSTGTGVRTVGLGTGGSSDSSSDFDLYFDEADQLVITMTLSSGSNGGTVYGNTTYLDEEYEPMHEPDWFTTHRTARLETSNTEAVVSTWGNTVTTTVTWTGGELDVEATTEVNSSSYHRTDEWVKFTEKHFGGDSLVWLYQTMNRRIIEKGVELVGDLENGFNHRKILFDHTWTETINAGNDPTEPWIEEENIPIYLDAFQAGLDAAGMVPLIGNAADALNVAIHIARGNKMDAAMSLAAMVPAFGQAAGGARLANRGANVVAKNMDKADEVAEVLVKQLDEAAGACKAAPNCFVAGTQVVVDINPGVADTIGHDALAEESEADFDAYFATGAFVLAGALSVQKTSRKESRLRALLRKLRK